MLGLGATPPNGDYYFPIRGGNDSGSYGRWEYSYDVWSNIHYGFIGTAAGFDAETLHGKGGLNGIPSADVLIGVDDPEDIEAEQIGTDLWQSYHTRITPSILHYEILVRKSKLQRIQWTNGF
jgi:hypothetical protein